MGIDHGRAHIRVAQELLDGPDVVAIFQEVGGKAVTQSMRATRLRNPCLEPRILDGLLEDTLTSNHSYPNVEIIHALVPAR